MHETIDICMLIHDASLAPDRPDGWNIELLQRDTSGAAAWADINSLATRLRLWQEFK